VQPIAGVQPAPNPPEERTIPVGRKRSGMPCAEEVPMRRSALSKSKPKLGSQVLVYVAGVRGRVKMTVPVLSPAAIRRSLKLSAASKRRVDRAMTEAGFGRKSG